jgi:hypothetical protein
MGFVAFMFIVFLVDYMFLSCFRIESIFVCQGHVFKNMAMFHVMGYVSIPRPCFSIHVFVSSICYCIESIFQVKGMFNCSFLVYIKVYFLLLGLYVSLSLCFINSIHPKDIHLEIKSSFCRFICFMSYTFIICHIFINFISSMFYILGLFLRLFHFFLAD